MANHTVYIRKDNEGKWEALKPSPAQWVNEQLEQAAIKPKPISPAEVEVAGSDFSRLTQ